MSVATHPEVKPRLPEVASQHSRNLTATKYSILYLLYSTTTTTAKQAQMYESHIIPILCIFRCAFSFSILLFE